MRHFLLLLSLVCFCTSVDAKRRGIYFFFDPIQQHLYEDENIQVAIIIDGVPKLVFVNKTDNIIYVDKENSFAYLNNVPENLFKNSVQTTGNTKNSGTSVNLGSVANAIGVGGTLGKLANGINVSGGSGTINSTMTYEKRILSIAPKSFEVLFSWNPMEDLRKVGYFSYDSTEDEAVRIVNRMTGQKTKIKKGMVINYQAGSPLNYKGFVKYAFNENMENANQITVDNQMTDLVIDSYKGITKGINYAPYAFPYTQAKPYLAVINGQMSNAVAALIGIPSGIIVGVGLAAIILSATED